MASSSRSSAWPLSRVAFCSARPSSRDSVKLKWTADRLSLRVLRKAWEDLRSSRVPSMMSSMICRQISASSGGVMPPSSWRRMSARLSPTAPAKSSSVMSRCNSLAIWA
ncbi:hypothetical protein D3C72_1576150 [compost metagenome]